MAVTPPELKVVGLSVLDGIALIGGTAIGSVHVKPLLIPALSVNSGAMLTILLIFISITSAGPFIYLVHRYYRPVAGFPRTGDRLWLILGLPWVVTGLVRAVVPTPSEPRLDDWYVPLLWTSLAISCVTVASIVWSTWIVVPGDQAIESFGRTWTNRLGLFLGVTWPIQLAAGMVVVG